MSGYVASARIVRVQTRLARRGADTELVDRLPAPAASETLATIELDAGGPSGPGATLAERRAAFRERWAQLTFFLLDGESWRT